jgi:hypothetical protein
MFHVVPYGETPSGGDAVPTDFDNGFLVGLLVGEGSFGGDGRQPQVTLRMHVRHEALFAWIEAVFPGGKLYGPYNHDGRRYYQWMARGGFLKDQLLPLLEQFLSPSLDGHSFRRYTEMKARYAGRLGLSPPTPAVLEGLAGPPSTTEEPGSVGE